ncbi:MAG: hypothetical protein KGJ58_04575 [Patescibacteria group bacterium]|nr:hypothetical protein [Patescibacteria group bacterium]MDE2218686.1 hypothetical protein [Patescibacteria group bacterium]
MTTTQQILRFLPIIIATAGFFLARYIFTKKRRKEKLVCLLDSDCDAVVHSRYSTFLGVPLEIFGMFYFAFIALFFLSAIFLPQLNSPYLLIFIPAIAFVSFLFSIYLASIQILLIKEWCMWCLISTILTTLLLAAILIASHLNVKGLVVNIVNKLFL